MVTSKDNDYCSLIDNQEVNVNSVLYPFKTSFFQQILCTWKKILNPRNSDVLLLQNLEFEEVF